MKIVEVTIQNIKAIEELRFTPGTLTLLNGANGVGKSSVLRAIGNIFEGGHNPDLIRHGAKRGVVTLILDNGVAVSKIITPKTSTLTITDNEGREVRSPKAYVEQLSKAMAVDPLRLLQLKPKELAQELLDTLGIEFPAAEVRVAAQPATVSVSSETIPLQNVESLISSIREDRKLVNRSARDAEGTINDLTKSLRNVEPVDLRPELAARKKEKSEVETGVLEALGVVDEEAHKEETETRDNYDAQIKELERLKTQCLVQIEQKRVSRRQAIQNEAQPERQRLTAEIATLEERIKGADQDQGVRNVIESHRDRLSKAVQKADALTLALERLEAMKHARLQRLPVNGLTFREGGFYLDDVPFLEQNQARQTYAACEIALLKSGALRAVILDNAEHLDGNSLAGAEQWARDNSCQVIAARVVEDDRDLEVEAKA